MLTFQQQHFLKANILRLIDIDPDGVDFETLTQEQADEFVTKAYGFPSVTAETPNQPPMVDVDNQRVLAGIEVTELLVHEVAFKERAQWAKLSGDQGLAELNYKQANNYNAQRGIIDNFSKKIGVRPIDVLDLYTSMMQALREGHFHWKEIGAQRYLESKGLWERE